MIEKNQKQLKLNLDQISINYIKLKLSLKGINTQEIQKSLGFELLTDSIKKLKVISAVMGNHKTIKNENEYNYNFWEFKAPEINDEYLICVLFENIKKNDGTKKLKINGYFIFTRNSIKSVNINSTINIFESDISGNYTREPKINKHQYFKNWKLLLED